MESPAKIVAALPRRSLLAAYGLLAALCLCGSMSLGAGAAHAGKEKSANDPGSHAHNTEEALGAQAPCGPQVQLWGDKAIPAYRTSLEKTLDAADPDALKGHMPALAATELFGVVGRYCQDKGIDCSKAVLIWEESVARTGANTSFEAALVGENSQVSVITLTYREDEDVFCIERKQQ